MAVGRIYIPIEGDSLKFNDAINSAVAAAEAGGIKITNAGKSFIAVFESALNPTLKLTDQIKLLEAAGKPAADILAVMGDKIKAAAEAAEKNGQPVSTLVQKYADLADQGQKSGVSIENLGKTLTEFAQNPIETAKRGITSFLTELGPVAVGIGAIATAAAAAGVAIFEFAKHASEEAESMENLSAMTGIGVQQLEAMDEMAKEAGLSSLDLGRTISKLNQELGAGEAPKAFTDGLMHLGVSIHDASGKTKDAVTILDEMREALLAIHDPTERAQLAQQVLGGRLRELIPLLLNSKEGIADTTKSFIEQGVAVDELTHKRLMEFDAMLDKIGRSIVIMKNELISLTMSVIGLGKSFVDFMDSFLGKKTLPELLFGSPGETDKAAKATADAIARTKEGISDLDSQYDINLRVLKATQEAEKINADHMKASNETAKKLAGEGLKSIADALKNLAFYIEKQDALGWDKLILAARQEYEQMAKTLPNLGIDIDKINKSIEDLGNLKPKGPDWSDVIVNTKKTGQVIVAEGKKTADDWSREVDRAFRRMAEGMAKSVIEWKGFWQTLTNIGKEFAEGMLTLVFDKLLQPFKDKLASLISDLMDKLMDVVGSVLKKGLSSITDSLASKAIGGGIGSIGGGAGGAIGGGIGSIGSIGSSLLTGGISAIGSILGGIIGGAMNSKDLGRIEENTRYTAIDTHGTVNTLWTLNDTMWVVAIKIQEGFATLFTDMYLVEQELGGIAKKLEVPGYAGGMDFIPNDGLAYLHRGEAVISRNDNRTSSFRGGDIYLSINGGTSSDLVATIKNRVIPILKREMIGGNSGLREAVRMAYDSTARAF